MDKKMQLVNDWINKAEHDLGMAELAIKNRPDFKDSICFHCQQSAEKYLKAYLIFLDIPFVKTHSLEYLLDLIDAYEHFEEDIYTFADILEGYAVEIRYPGDSFEPSDKDIKEVWEASQSIKQCIISKISEFIK